MPNSEGLNSEGSNGADRRRRIMQGSVFVVHVLDKFIEPDTETATPRGTWDPSRVGQSFCRFA